MAEFHPTASSNIEARPTRYRVKPGAPPPRKLTSDQNFHHFHPCYQRVGVRVNGVERKDIIDYDQDAGTVKLRGGLEIKLCVVEPFWRHEENRQQRRFRERWEASHG